MFTTVGLLLVGLGAVVITFAGSWWSAITRDEPPHGRPSVAATLIGFVTLFFDTLGIGNFAPTTAVFKLTKMVQDELIPGTMNVGSAIPVAIEAFAFVTLIAVDPTTLWVLVPLGFVGAWLGAQVVSRLPARPIQIGMGLALLVGAMLMTATNLQLIPGGGDALGFSGGTLGFAAALNFALGALNALGIGSYAPSLLAFSLLGMNPRAAFPIMMGSAAYMLNACGIRFAKTGRFDGRAALALTVGGIPGVLIAAFIVKSLPLDAIRWLVVCVVSYASISMLSAARRSPPLGSNESLPPRARS
jgi:uncharacterized membrane protein YfcA